MEMPRPTDHHTRMSRLAGAWRGEDTLLPSPWDPSGGRAASRMEARTALAGFHLFLDFRQERDGRLGFEGHGVLGWDARGKCYTMHWFDCMGAEHGMPYYGPWEGDVLMLTHESHHLMHGRQIYRFQADGALRFELQYSQDGRRWTTFLVSQYQREP